MPKKIDHVILIVGGGLGIGWETTKAALETSPPSTHVVVCGLHRDSGFDALANAHNGRLDMIQGDVTNTNDRQKVVDHTMETLGRLDTLVYCAGVIGPVERIDKMDIEAVKRSYDVNVFGAMAMAQLAIPHLRASRYSNLLNDAFGKIIILSSGCDSTISYHGWSTYCTSKAALTRFVAMLAHEEPMLSVQGVYPKLTRTTMPEDIIAGKYKGVMADHEIERFRIWNEIGDQWVEPPSWCGEAVAKLAVGLFRGGKSGEVLYYDEHVAMPTP